MGGIVWLASYPKSGNTWTRAFLHNLLRNPDRPVDINELDRFCFGDSIAAWYERLAGRKVTELAPKEIAALRPRVHAAFARSSPDSVFVKTHNIMAEAEGVPLISQAVSAGAIYVLRNPLDVVLSVADHFGLNLDQAIDMLANPTGGSPTDERNVYEVYGSWSAHVESWTRPGHQAVHVVRYEDMLERPQRTFAALAAFLGLRPPRARLEKAIRFSSFKVLSGQERAHGFRERSVHSQRFFRVGAAGQWKTALSAAQVARVVEAHRAQMARFGYLPEGYA